MGGGSGADAAVVVEEVEEDVLVDLSGPLCARPGYVEPDCEGLVGDVGSGVNSGTLFDSDENVGNDDSEGRTFHTEFTGGDPSSSSGGLAIGSLVV
jgi:hypothetical protein